jgi:hypothetical protein
LTERPGTRRVLLLLLAGALFLPIAIVLIVTVGRLLAALGDPAGSTFFDRLALAVGIAWVLDLIGLPIVLAIERLLADAPEVNIGDELGEEHE